MDAFNSAFEGGVATDAYNTYLIFLGPWQENNKALIRHFLNNVGTSSWYYQMLNKQVGKNPKNHILLKGEIEVPLDKIPPLIKGIYNDDYDAGGEYWLRSLKEDLTKSYSAMKNWDSKGIFIFLSSNQHSFPALKDTRWMEGSWYASFCGTHSFGINLTQKKSGTNKDRFIYAYDQSLARSSCIPDSMSKPPNGDKSLDALINVIAHELIETTSGYDIGNQCVYQYGTIKKLPDGRQYTEKMGDKYYFLQQNFNYKTQKCMSG